MVRVSPGLRRCLTRDGLMNNREVERTLAGGRVANLQRNFPQGAVSVPDKANKMWLGPTGWPGPADAALSRR
jgi:hypothetical protein